MKQTSTRWKTVGLDISDKQSTFVVLDAKGQVTEEGKVATKPASIRERFSGGRWRIALEVGTHSPWISRLLQELGHEVIVANPRQVALIARNQRKTDRLDALRLAKLARIDPALLEPVQHRSRQAQEHLELLRGRDQLVACRTALINHVRSAVKSVGQRLPACSSPSFAARVRSQIPEGLEASVVELLDEIQSLSQRIKRLDRQVDELIQKHYPAARMFMEQLHGVGPLTALAYVLTLETPERFTSSRDIGAYLGLTRRQRDSGESTPRLHITKAGDAFLRRLLVQCAHYILGPFGKDSDLRRWALKLSERLGRKRAIVACARKLAVLMHHLWTSGEVYEPLRPQRIVEAA